MMADQAKWNRLHNTKEETLTGSAESPFRVGDIYHMNTANLGYSGGLPGKIRYAHYWHAPGNYKQKGIYRPADQNGSPIIIQRYLDDYVEQVPEVDGRNQIGGIRWTGTGSLAFTGWDQPGAGPAASADMLQQYGTGYLPRYYGNFFETIPDTMIRIETPGVANPLESVGVMIDSISIGVYSEYDQDNGLDTGDQVNSPPSDGFSITALPIFDESGIAIPECFALLLMYSGPYFGFSNGEYLQLEASISVSLGASAKTFYLSHTLLKFQDTN